MLNMKEYNNDNSIVFNLDNKQFGDRICELFTKNEISKRGIKFRHINKQNRYLDFFINDIHFRIKPCIFSNNSKIIMYTNKKISRSIPVSYKDILYNIPESHIKPSILQKKIKERVCIQNSNPKNNIFSILFNIADNKNNFDEQLYQKLLYILRKIKKNSFRIHWANSKSSRKLSFIYKSKYLFIIKELDEEYIKVSYMNSIIPKTVVIKASFDSLYHEINIWERNILYKLDMNRIFNLYASCYYTKDKMRSLYQLTQQYKTVKDIPLEDIVLIALIDQDTEYKNIKKQNLYIEFSIAKNHTQETIILTPSIEHVGQTLLYWKHTPNYYIVLNKAYKEFQKQIPLKYNGMSNYSIEDILKIS